jgi:hypothetical protein
MQLRGALLWMFTLPCAALLAGCAIGTQRFGRPIDASRIGSIQIGVSTKADVLRDFGPPTAYASLPVVPPDPAEALAENILAAVEADNRVFVYEYREDRENFFTVILFTRFRRQVLSDRLMVFFDPRDVVRYVAYARETPSDDSE